MAARGTEKQVMPTIDENIALHEVLGKLSMVMIPLHTLLNPELLKMADNVPEGVIRGLAIAFIGVTELSNFWLCDKQLKKIGWGINPVGTQIYKKTQSTVLAFLGSRAVDYGLIAITYPEYWKMISSLISTGPGKTTEITMASQIALGLIYWNIAGWAARNHYLDGPIKKIQETKHKFVEELSKDAEVLEYMGLCIQQLRP